MTTPAGPKPRFRPIIRVFVSSTFSDLVHERNALQNHVWPELERFCLAQGFQFQAIDLRWGVPGEAGLDHRTMRICMEELRRAQDVSPQPNFLILLGDRYGWRPLPEEITEAEFQSLKAEATAQGELEALETWYRCDKNAVPPVYVLRSRRPDDRPPGDTNDYTFATRKTRDNPEAADTPWEVVEKSLWRIINRAFPPSSANLVGRFQHIPRRDGPLPSLVKFQASATEQEIWHGALRVADAPQHVLAFSREIGNLGAVAGSEALRDFVNVEESGNTDPILHEAVRTLKAQLRRMLGENYLEAPEHATLQRTSDSGGEPRLEISTDHLDFLCTQVHDRLLPIIQQQIDDYHRVPETVAGASLSGEVLRDLKREREEHQRFAAERAPVGVFVGRESEKAKILAYLAGLSDRPFIVHGVSGSGKSALLAAAAREAAAQPGAIVVERFLGITKRSSDLRSLLIDLCQGLREHFPLADELPTDVRLLEKEFYEQLKNATAERPIHVFLDALDQLDPADAADSLWWIRSTPLPPHARLVLSCLSDPDDEAAGRPYAVLKQRGFLMPDNSAPIEHLSPPEAQLLWTRWLDQAGRTLTDEQQAAVDARILAPEATECRRPLYLRILFEEARLWRSHDSPPQLGGSVSELLRSLFDRLGHPAAHGPLVEPALAYLVSARYGLVETELLEILLRDPDYRHKLIAGAQHALPPQAKRIPIALWSRLRYDLAPYLTERGAPGGSVLHFYHRQVGSYVAERFAGTPARRYQWHRRLARYFRRQPWWLESPEEQRRRMQPPDSARPAHVRKIMELPDQLLALAREAKAAGLSSETEQAYEWIERLFEKLPFLEAENEAGLVFELVVDFSRALDILPETRAQRRILRLLEEALRRDTQFVARHAQGYPQCLFQCLWNSGWWYDCPEAAAHYLPSPSGRGAAGEGDGRQGAGEAPLRPWQQPGPRLYLLLERWRHQKESDEPGFPWLRSLRPPPMHLGTAQLAVLRGHESWATSVAFSPGGDRIVSGSWDHTVRVWDARSGAELAVLCGHEGYVWSVAFSPGGDRIVSGSGDKTVRVWDARSGAELAVLRGHEDGLAGVAFSPDGDRIVSGSWDGTVRVWDARSGAELAVLRGHEMFVTSVAFSPGGDRIVSGSGDQTVRVWDARSGAELAALRGHERDVTSVAFSPGGERIVSGSADRTVRMWDARSGAELAVLRGHEYLVTSVAFSPGGDRIVSGSNDTTVRVWDARSGAELAVLRGHENFVNSVAFSPDGGRIVSGSWDQTVRVWDARGGAELAVLRGHENTVLSVAFSPGGDRIVSGSWDKTVRVWDTRSGAELAVLRGHDGFVRSVAFSLGGDRIVSGSEDKTVRVWDARSGAELAVLRGHEGGVMGVAFSPGGDRIVSGSWDHTVRVWDAASGAELAVLRGHKDRVTGMAFSPGGDRVASGSVDGTVRVWDARSGAELAVLRGRENYVSSVAFSPGGDRIVGGSLYGTVQVWDASSDDSSTFWPLIRRFFLGRALAVMRGHEEGVRSVAFSPDGDRIVSGSWDETVRVWDAANGQCLEVIRGSGDLRAIAAGSQAFPLRALARGLETVVERADSSQRVAWYPASLGELVTHPSGCKWAGAVGSYLCLITLEGGNTLPAENEPQLAVATSEPTNRP